jgi:hypothetical protein
MYLAKHENFFNKKLRIEKKQKKKESKRVTASFVRRPSRQEGAPSPPHFLLLKLG